MEEYYNEAGKRIRWYDYDEIRSYCAAHLLTDLYQKLGLKKREYLHCLSAFLDKEDPPEIKTIRSWRRKERGLPAKYTYERIMEALDSLVSEVSFQNKEVSKRWKEYRETFSKRILLVLNDDFFPDMVEQFSEIIGDIFEKLTSETAFILYNYFEVLNSLTQYDMDFLNVLARPEKHEKKNYIRQRLNRQAVQGGNVLSCLQNGDALRWLQLLGRHDTVRDKADIRERLLEKVTMYGFNSMAWRMILNVLIDQDTGAFVDSIGQEEMSLFVLFKYCLSQEEQVGLLEDTREKA